MYRIVTKEALKPTVILYEIEAPMVAKKAQPGQFIILRVFHIKDHREIGQSGMVGFDAIFKNAKTAGVQYLVAEIEKYSMPVEESVEVSLDYLLNAPFVEKSYTK